MFPLGADTITVTEPGVSTGRDANFMPIPGTPTITDVLACSVQPLSTTEVNTYMDLTTLDKKALCPPVEPLLSLKTDAVLTWQGDDYQLYGEPQIWRNRLGILHHVTIYMRKARATRAA